MIDSYYLVTPTAPFILKVKVMARISMFGMGKHLYRERCSVYLLSLLTNFIYTGARCNTGGLSEFEQFEQCDFQVAYESANVQ